MKNEITFTVFGDPIALKRHRMTKTGHSYDPSAADKADFLSQAMRYKPSIPLTGPLLAGMAFGFARPKSHFNKKGLKPTAPKYKASRPDLDNCVKFILDALNSKFFADDAQVVKTVAVKEYADVPNVTVTLSEIEA